MRKHAYQGDKMGALALFLLLDVSASSATSASVSPMNVGEQAAIEKLYSGDKIQSEWFSSSLQGFMAPMVSATIRSEIRDGGAFTRSVPIEKHSYRVELKHGTYFCKILLNDDGKIRAFATADTERDL